ncbi:DUF1559 family PulG-like putative transporter [Stratiformator vulcanicus]|uniref:DUF1559 domain-containing protein n=1 Tax=Stratiformator vulcanicus TaxID=2527980 RepID=A0A517QX18_9PLAN|nr:DUF1559 domain-containing protein [Stratiformator vulcanicus]QDT36181.1 hypothetical protein Pan189_05360 [Stratiformator vulcanicus]
MADDLDVQYAEPVEPTRRQIVKYWLVAFGGLAILVLLSLPNLGTPMEVSRRSACKNNLKRIAIALHNYHDKWDSLPPAVTYGPDGKPRHSWRVLILPHLVENAEFDYRFDEPWDGPHNRKLHSTKFNFYRCPSDAHAYPDENQEVHTSYFAVTGPDTMFPQRGVVSLRDVPDGASNTIMIVERSNSGIHWMKPTDLTFDEARLPGDPLESIGTRSEHVPGKSWAPCALADGSVHFIGDHLEPETLRRLILRNDGEIVGEF